MCVLDMSVFIPPRWRMRPRMCHDENQYKFQNKEGLYFVSFVVVYMDRFVCPGNYCRFYEPPYWASRNECVWLGNHDQPCTLDFYGYRKTSRQIIGWL